jgi:hypothetical protein
MILARFASTLLLASLGACLAAGPAAAAKHCTQDGAEKYIVDSEAAWAASTAGSDISVPKRILADDYVGVGSGGHLFDKSAMLKEAAEGPADFLSDHQDYAHVRFFSSYLAVAQGASTFTRKTGDQTSTGRFIWTDTWICRAGRWQVVASEDVIAPVTH